MFKNLSFFRFAPITGAEAQRKFRLDLDDGTAAHALKPVGPGELSSRGWVFAHPSVAPAAGGRLPYVLTEGLLVLTLGGEDRLLPASVVNAELQKRIAKVEEAEGHKLGGRARKRLREDLVMELLPRALVKPSRLTGYLDLARGLVVVDTASRKAAEGFVSELRNTLGSFPALPVNAEVSPRAVLTNWLQGGGVFITEPSPNGRYVRTAAAFALGDEVELRDPVDGGAVAKLRHQELMGEEVRKHLEAGKQVAQLGLVYGRTAGEERVAFTFGEDLVVRKFKLLDVVLEQHEGEDHGSLEAELDARYTILTAEVGALFDRLAEAFRFSPVEG